MDRRQALLIVIAILVMVDLVGIVALRSAWRDRHHKTSPWEHPAAPAEPASAAPEPVRPIMQTGV